jgi:hypothetical protein
MIGTTAKFPPLTGAHFIRLDQVIGNSNRIGDDRKRRIHRTARREEGAVDDIEIVEIVSATIEVENGLLRIFSKPACAILMTDTFDVDVFFEVGVPGEDRIGVTGSFQHVDPAVLSRLNDVWLLGVYSSRMPPSTKRTRLLGSGRSSVMSHQGTA